MFEYKNLVKIEIALIKTYFETPFLPKVLVRDSSGRMQTRFLRCSGSRIQSSQKLNKNEF